MVLPITAYGHPVLKKRAEEIDKNYPDLQKLIEDMFETMYETVGVGLAAPQVNRSIRLFIVDATPYAEEDKHAENFKKVFINPEITEENGEEDLFKESCLSLPNLSEYVSRQPKIRIRYMDEDFNEHEEEYDGMVARIIQHEYDHLEGILYVDRLSNFTRTLLKRKLKDIETGKIDPPYKMLFANKKSKIKT